MSTRLDRFGFWALTCVAACLVLVATLVTLAGSQSEYGWLEALARATMVGAPIAVGIYAWRQSPVERFGRLFTIAGVLTFVTTLAESGDPALYSIGRVAGWVLGVWIIYLVLAFPVGTLPARIDRVLVTASALVVLVLYLPSALVVEQYSVPAPWTSCHSECPENAFMVTASEPAVIEDVVRPLRELLTAVLFAAVAVRLVQRIGEEGRLARRADGPLLAVALVWLLGYVAAVVGQRRWPESGVVEAVTWLVALGIPMLAAAFLVGVARWRLFVARAVQRLASSMRAHPGPEDVRSALAGAFEDPSLEIVYWRGKENAGWCDAEGRRIRLPPPDSGRCITEVKDAGRPAAAIIHDCALRDDETFINSASSYAVMTLDNYRLSAEASALLREVSESRARIQKSADEERRRIESDLHDGAQQRLVALRVKLELAAEKHEGGPSADLLRALGAEVDVALDELRLLAHGIYPSPLADRGLVEALRSAALQGELPTTVLATGVRPPYPREIESTVYFACIEALQNAAKHARGANVVVIELAEQEGCIRVEVRDDGAGFDPAVAPAGLGLTSIRDRFAAVAGEVAIVSSPGQGTRVIGSIPVAGASGGGPDSVRSSPAFRTSGVSLASRVARR